MIYLIKYILQLGETPSQEPLVRQDSIDEPSSVKPFRQVKLAVACIPGSDTLIPPFGGSCRSGHFTKM